VDFEERYGELTDEPKQMYSAEAAVRDDAVIVCGMYMSELIEEMSRYLISRN
jgi:hypothetical protein